METDTEVDVDRVELTVIETVVPVSEIELEVDRLLEVLLDLELELELELDDVEVEAIRYIFSVPLLVKVWT